MELVNKVLTYWYSYFPPMLLHLVGFLLTLNCDERDHEFKIYYNFLLQMITGSMNSYGKTNQMR